MKSNGGASRLSLARIGFVAALFAIASIACSTNNSFADEGGVSFWLPGLYGSLAAVPQQPGWSLWTSYYFTSVSAGGDVGLARELEIRNIPVGVSATLSGSLHSTGDLGLIVPSYTFATPVFGGQLSLSMMGIYGNVSGERLERDLAALQTPLPAPHGGLVTVVGLAEDHSRR